MEGHNVRFSVCVPYHNNPGMWLKHIEVLGDLPAFIRNNIEFLLCDDASDPQEQAWLPTYSEAHPLPAVRVFRIEPPHIPWSHRCASNISAHYATGEWLIVTDVDHVMNKDAWIALFAASLEPERVYLFSRRNADGSEYKPHPDSWLMHRRAWDKVGGYDTRYRGVYGQNRPFIDRVKSYYNVHQLTIPLTRFSRDDIPDASERVLTRKSLEARNVINARMREYTRNGTFLQRGEIVPHIEVTA